MSDVDPYTQVIRALWLIVEDVSDFGKLVKPGNRIRFDGSDRDPVKGDVSEADLPEVLIFASNTTPNTPGTTSSSFAELVTFEIQVASGDQRLSHKHFPVMWALTRAFANVGGTLARLRTLTWNDEVFVNMVRVTGTTTGISETDLNRVIKGWAGTVTVDVLMIFRLSSL